MSIIVSTAADESGPLPGAPPARHAPAAGASTPAPYFRWKGLFDRVAAVALLVPGLPLIGLLALLVRLTSRGPAIYRQTRTGGQGRPFTLYKLRTMRLDAEAATGAVWSRTDDPRVTRLGRVLRALHLDELPQLFNVVRGDMSLVGPQPERPEFIRVLARQVPGYLDRLTIPPGVTGLAQLNLPPDTDLNSVRRKLALDLQYAAQASLLLDLRILACTFVRMLNLSAVDILKLRCAVPSFGHEEAAAVERTDATQRRAAPTAAFPTPIVRLSPAGVTPGGNGRSGHPAGSNPAVGPAVRCRACQWPTGYCCSAEAAP